MAKPSTTPPPNKSHKSGLSLGATVGIAIGIALLVIFGALFAWILVRRRRRRWGKKRNRMGEVGVVGVVGDSPDVEILRKVEQGKKGVEEGDGSGGGPELRGLGKEKSIGVGVKNEGVAVMELDGEKPVVELDGEKLMVELDGEKPMVELDGEKERAELPVLGAARERPVSELHSEERPHELSTREEQVVEIGESGRGVVAELDGTPMEEPHIENKEIGASKKNPG
ncbi:uncharacterized protein BDR25DRAFT_309108 [Lindgomyces ingoldianus]|uniref:Uncharacterized protein n=1 Tax=Lindgomyces ingoldianus TaxID=673940 RepID=A0ACB6RGT0_9PLEO|nr:uncharacterized protein BDR25DRAFT_309108 [Lindgomyces ingoldianus]KAF2478337.1 hypothetical protein BDR25DRAFT_309108 [Lindgomyces ingoldianus]